MDDSPAWMKGQHERQAGQRRSQSKWRTGQSSLHVKMMNNS